MPSARSNFKAWAVTAARQTFRFLPDSLIIQLNHLYAHARFPRLNSPQRFSDYLAKHMLTGNAVELAKYVDKLSVRDYVSQICGPEVLVPLIRVFDTADEFELSELPNEFVVKATHGSQMTAVITDATSIDLAEMRKKLRCWLNTDQSKKYGERVYRYVPRRLLVEAVLGEGTIPPDYKFYVFHGQVQLFHVDSNRFSHVTRDWFSRDGGALNVTRGSTPRSSVLPKLPASLPNMIRIAELLGEPFEFVRVDLYSVDNRIYFGELTFYPGAGSTAFKPLEFEILLGKIWSEGGTIGREWFLH